MGEYSVATTNRFALQIDEDEDLYELLKQKEEQKKKKEEAPPPEPVKTKGKEKKSSKVARMERQAKSVAAAESKVQSNGPATHYRNDENRPPRFARQRPEGGRDEFEKPNQPDGARRGRGGVSGFRGGRGMRGNGGFGGRPRREFDRHSGSDKTGIKAVEKREGGGPHNWGNEVDAQLEAETEVTEQPTETTENADTSAVDVKPVEEAEPEPVQLTLEEWKAAQQSSKPKVEFKVRKANEGADSKQWKGTVALQRKKKSEESSEEEYSDDEEEEFSDSGRSAPRGRGGFRGGRGGFGESRGPRAERGGRGGNRGGRGGARMDNKVQAPQINDDEFPSLGGGR